MAKLDASAVATLLVEIGQRPVWISSALSNALTVESCSRAALPSAKDFFAYAAVSVAMAAKAFEAVACVVRTRPTLIRLNFCLELLDHGFSPSALPGSRLARSPDLRSR